MSLTAGRPLRGRRGAGLSGDGARAVGRGLGRGFGAAAAALVDRRLAQGEIDAIRDIAEAYPLGVFPDALGLPPDGRENLLPFGNFVSVPEPSSLALLGLGFCLIRRARAK